MIKCKLCREYEKQYPLQTDGEGHKVHKISEHYFIGECDCAFDIDGKFTTDWNCQTDEGELGYTYEQIDRELRFINTNYVKGEKYIELLKPSPAIMDRIEKNKFKSELPKIIKE